ncbi:MAG: DUF6259 domain-containing protein, partial [Thermoguttaceae bacterium]
MNRSFLPRRSLGVLLLAVWVLVPPAAGGEPADRRLSIDNGSLRLGVAARDAAILELADMAADRNLVGDAGRLVGLWSLNLAGQGKTTTLEPSQAKDYRAEKLPPGEIGLRFTWDGLPLPGSAPALVEVVVRLDQEQPVSRWGISIQLPDGWHLDEVRFPRLAGLRRQDHERLAVPLWMGQMSSTPRDLLKGSDGKGRRLAWSYPGWMSLQCLAYYAEGGSGLYAACDDTAVCHKAFALWGTPEGDVGYEMVHYPQQLPDRPGRYTLPYSAVLGAFQGDWITAAERYRAWAVHQTWAQQSRLHRGLVPDWVLQTGAWVWNRGRSPGVLLPASELHRRLGLPVSVFWHWWHGCPYDIGFPEYLPPREGTDPFRQAVARAHGDDLHMLVYMNQRAWGLDTKSWQADGAERFAVKARNGKFEPEVYNIFTGQALVSMCLGTSFWRDRYADLAQQAVNDLGVDGIYMDQACSHKPCYDPGHGHPPGGGNSWMDGFRDLSEEIRHRARGKSPVVLAGEGCGEAWLPWLDLMLSLQVSQERYSSPSNPWEVIPFFHAVYHAYAVTYGNYSSLVMPPYDDLWPAEFAPAEPLALLDRKFSRQFYLEQARTFVWGQQPTLANFRPVLLEQRKDEIDYLVRLAQVRSRATKYLLRGEFLRPPLLDAPEVTSDFSRLSIYAGQKDRLTTCLRRHPLALAGAWRAADGDVAVALASLADEPLALSLAIDRNDYRLPARPKIFRIDADGRRPLEASLDDNSALVVPMAPRDVC